MNEKQSNISLLKYPTKRCIACKVMFRKKDSEFCYRCDPNKTKIKYNLPSFNKLTTVQGIRKAYTNLLNAIRHNRISRDEANTMFYGLKCFIGSLKDILEMRITMEDNKPLITDIKIEQMKQLILKMENLHNKFKQSDTPQPSGEITQSPNTQEVTDNI